MAPNDDQPEVPAQPPSPSPSPPSADPPPATIEPFVPLLSPMTENFPIAAPIEADPGLLSDLTRAAELSTTSEPAEARDAD